MSWWRRQKTGLPVLKKPNEIQTLKIDPPERANVINFPQKRVMSPEARAKTHKLLDNMIDQMEEDEFIYLAVCSPADD